MTTGILMGNSAGIYTISATLTPASVATIVTVTQTFTVTGLKTTDLVLVNPPAQLAGVSITAARVSAADTLAITFVNPTAGSLTPTAGAYVITVIRPSGGIQPTVISD